MMSKMLELHSRVAFVKSSCLRCLWWCLVMMC